MKTLVGLVLSALSLLGSQARAEYMEIFASQIVTTSADKDANPSILVQWDLPKDLDKLIIDAAVIAMTIPVLGDEPLEIDAHAMLRAWHATDVGSSDDWTKGEAVYDGEISSPAIVTKENKGKVSLDVYLQVLDQIAGTAANFGFILAPASGGTSKVQTIVADAPDSLADAKLIIAYRTRR